MLWRTEKLTLFFNPVFYKLRKTLLEKYPLCDYKGQEEAFLWLVATSVLCPLRQGARVLIGRGLATGAQKPKKGRRQAKHGSTARARLLKLVFPNSVPTKVCIFN